MHIIYISTCSGGAGQPLERDQGLADAGLQPRHQVHRVRAAQAPLRQDHGQTGRCLVELNIKV